MDENINIFGETKKSEYSKFVEKFKPKLTTDDCFTPPLVYEAVADWVVNEYGADRKSFCRPFRPGGDYKTENYAGKVVVDNPPFSILSEIRSFYVERCIPFFLFAPTLTMFSSRIDGQTFIPAGCNVIYENGAQVNTSFITNMDDLSIVVRTAPSLYAAVTDAVAQIRSAQTKPLPKYEYPDNVITSAIVARWSKYGVQYALRRDESVIVPALDAQRKVGKSIFGKGFLISERAAAERAAAERAAAERAAAERAAAERWELSYSELTLVAKLSGREDVPPLFREHQDAEMEGL